MTVQEQLNEVNAAISAILGGSQEYSIGSRRLKRADLKTLFDERKNLEAALASQNNCMTTVAVFDRR